MLSAIRAGDLLTAARSGPHAALGDGQGLRLHRARLVPDQALLGVGNRLGRRTTSSTRSA